MSSESSSIVVLDPTALDRIRAIQRPGRPDIASRVLQLYLDKSPAQLDVIAAAAAAADGTALARAAHDLKGGSGNLGLSQMVDVLARIEQHAKRAEIDAATALVALLPTAHTAALAAVRGELARSPPTQVSP